MWSILWKQVVEKSVPSTCLAVLPVGHTVSGQCVAHHHGPVPASHQISFLSSGTRRQTEPTFTLESLKYIMGYVKNIWYIIIYLYIDHNIPDYRTNHHWAYWPFVCSTGAWECSLMLLQKVMLIPLLLHTDGSIRGKQGELRRAAVKSYRTFLWWVLMKIPSWKQFTFSLFSDLTQSRWNPSLSI